MSRSEAERRAATPRQNRPRRSEKKLALIVTGVLLLACLFPMPNHLKDGGTVEYRALLYTVSRVRRLNGLETEKPLQEGLIVKLLGIEVYNDVE